jgi:hypothetical protein
MQIALDPVTKAQENLGPVTIQNPHLIYVFVAIAPPGSGRDRFFILTKAQLQLVCINMYSAWMDKLEWKRPRNPASYDCRHRMSDMQQYENNWQLITDTLATTRFSQSLESTEA